MTGAAPLCIVSHRLPVTHEPDLGWVRSPGGLVSALGPLLHERPAVWFGHWMGPGRLDQDSSRALVDLHPGTRLEPIRLSEHEFLHAIDGYSNRTLWPALHGLLENVEQSPDWWTGYQRRTERTAALIAEKAPDGAVVWLHDYHHFGVPGPLRRRRPDLSIVMSCHTPVDDTGLRSISGHPALAEALAACDVIGTQSRVDAEGLERFLDASGLAGSVPVVVSPVGFDVTAWHRYRVDPVVRTIAARHRRVDGTLMVGVDRIDYVKGLTHKLLALELLLDTGRLGADELRLIQILVPSRATIPIYRFLADQIVQIGARINQRFPRRDGRPVVDLVEGQIPPREIAGPMRAADIGLVTPLRDGMNLVALEFSVLNGDRPADLILGRGAGAVDTIGAWSDVVDAGDVLAVASTIVDVVRRGPEDRLARSAKRAAAAAERTSDSWARSLLDPLDLVAPATLTIDWSCVAPSR